MEKNLQRKKSKTNITSQSQTHKLITPIQNIKITKNIQNRNTILKEKMNITILKQPKINTSKMLIHNKPHRLNTLTQKNAPPSNQNH